MQCVRIIHSSNIMFGQIFDYDLPSTAQFTESLPSDVMCITTSLSLLVSLSLSHKHLNSIWFVAINLFHPYAFPLLYKEYNRKMRMRAKERCQCKCENMAIYWHCWRCKWMLLFCVPTPCISPHQKSTHQKYTRKWMWLKYSEGREH